MVIRLIFANDFQKKIRLKKHQIVQAETSRKFSKKNRLKKQQIFHPKTSRNYFLKNRLKKNQIFLSENKPENFQEKIGSKSLKFFRLKTSRKNFAKILNLASISR